MTTKSKTTWILCLVIILTNLSQLPIFVESRTTQYMSFLCWGILAFCCLRPESKININLFLLSLFIIPLFAALVFSTLTTNDYISSRIFYSLIIAFGVFVLSNFIPKDMLGKDLSDLDLVYKAYILSAVLVSINIYLNYFISGINFDYGYEYDSKNSASQIVITAVIVSFFVFDKTTKTWNLINAISLIINLILIFLMRSRASIIGLAIVIVMVVFDKNVVKSVKILLVIATIIFLGLVFFNESIYDLFINKILFASRDSSSLDDLSSGRFNQWVKFPALFAESPFIGRGRYKIESFPLSVLVQYGFIFGGMIILLSIYPVIYAIKNRKNGKHFKVLLIVVLVYLLNGIFEELSPFGPGVKCYFIWFMLGVLMREKNYGRTRSN